MEVYYFITPTLDGLPPVLVILVSPNQAATMNEIQDTFSGEMYLHTLILAETLYLSVKYPFGAVRVEVTMLADASREGQRNEMKKRAVEQAALLLYTAAICARSKLDDQI